MSFLRRVHEWVGRFFGPDEYEAAAIGQQEDLLVYFALSHFGRRRPYSQLPGRLQRDVQFFFGSITKARNAGERALFAAGDSARLEEATVFCHDELGIGVLNEDHDLTFHQSVLGINDESKRTPSDTCSRERRFESAVPWSGATTPDRASAPGGATPWTDAWRNPDNNLHNTSEFKYIK